MITVRRYYFNPLGHCIDMRDAPFETLESAKKYCAMLRETIRRQGDNALAAIIDSAGKTVKF